jgi:YggT family protein
MIGVISILILALNIYSIILIIRVLLTWLPNVDYSNPAIKLLHNVTEPVLRPIRQALPKNSGFDFSPLVVTVAIMLVTALLRQVIYIF